MKIEELPLFPDKCSVVKFLLQNSSNISISHELKAAEDRLREFVVKIPSYFLIKSLKYFQDILRRDSEEV